MEGFGVGPGRSQRGRRDLIPGSLHTDWTPLGRATWVVGRTNFGGRT